MEKLIFRFSSRNLQSNFKSKEILGGKGANLAQMSKLGLPVPPGFTISTKVCEYFFENVIVNDENSDIKKNRLELLKMFCNVCNNFVNFSKIEGA